MFLGLGENNLDFRENNLDRLLHETYFDAILAPDGRAGKVLALE